MIEHSVKQLLQPTNHSCTPTALAILLSHYNIDLTPEEIMVDVPVNTDDTGNDLGTISQDLAVWTMQTHKVQVVMYSFDFQILDLGWAELPAEKIIDRLQTVEDVRDVPALGKKWSKRYVQSYVNFLKQGGTLRIKSYVTQALIDGILQRGPVFINVGAQTFLKHGRTSNPGIRQEAFDDVHGNVTVHSVIVTGKNKLDEYKIADPWRGGYSVPIEQLLAGITAAQLECDNLLFYIEGKGK